MNPILRNILVVILAVFVGSIVNYLIAVNLGIAVVGMPEGVTMENIMDNMDKFEFKHYIFPFLGHALGTLVGAFIAAKWSTGHHMKFAIGIGIWFLVGGILNSMLLKTGMTVNLIDWVFAYIPMAWIGGKLAERN